MENRLEGGGENEGREIRQDIVEVGRTGCILRGKISQIRY